MYTYLIKIADTLLTIRKQQHKNNNVPIILCRKNKFKLKIFET